MKTWRKVAIGLGGAALVGGIVWFSINQANKGVVTVQTAKVAKLDSLVSQVTASGEIKPTTYTNITAQGFGRITEILVKEGDHIKKGDKLLLQDNVQANADVQAQDAAINSGESGVQAAEASYKATQADLVTQQANLEKAKLDYERGQGLYKDGLIAKQDFDQRKTTYDAAVATVDASRARMLAQKAQLEEVRAQLAQGKAVLVHTKDVLSKTTYTSPINGIVSYLPVRMGEYVVPGIQNATGSFLMTLSDMSTVTSEVKVDETDIINVRDWARCGCHHRCGSRQSIQRQSDRHRVASRPAHLRFGHYANHHEQPGSQGLQSRGYAGESPRESPPRPFHYRQKSKPPSAKVSLESLFRLLPLGLAKIWKRRLRTRRKNGNVTLAAPPPAAAGDPKKDEVQGVFVVNGKKAILPSGGDRHFRRNQHRNHQGTAAGRRNCDWQLQSTENAETRSVVKIDNTAPKKLDDSQ